MIEFRTVSSEIENHLFRNELIPENDKIKWNAKNGKTWMKMDQTFVDAPLIRGCKKKNTSGDLNCGVLSKK